jgi:hypothetical protein
MAKFRVQYHQIETVIARYSIEVEAETFAQAHQRVADWGKGEIDLTDDEEQTETHEREVEQTNCEFLGVLPVGMQGNTDAIEREG